VASAHPLATEAGLEVLGKGGNAFDAAVAVSAALSVVEPYGSGLGGGGFWLLHRASDDLTTMVDGREVAPAAAHEDMYLDASGNPIRGASINGPLAAGIPGLPAALVHIAKTYGRLPLATSLAPAIRYAEQGFVASPRMAMGLRFRTDTFAKSPAAMAVFMPDGKPPGPDTKILQPDLAVTLRALAKRGAKGFYRGKVARQLVKGVRDAGGIWTRGDLAGYKVVERQPLRSRYKDVDVITAAPPSSGGVAIINMLNMLSDFDLEALDGAAARQHLLVEVMRRAYRDRAEYLGDPDFVDIPMQRLLHPFYAAGQLMSLRMDRATPSADLPGIMDAPGGGGSQTTHFSLVDDDGNIVAGTQTLNTWYGSAFMPPGTGVLLNNEMDDFSIKAGEPNAYQLIGAAANAIAPGKRMLSSMTPTILRSDRGLAVLGTPGGSRIISMVLLAGLAWMDGASAAEMVALPRLHHQYMPDMVMFEPDALSEAEQSALKALGHELRAARRRYGNMQVVTWDFASGVTEAASDPRADGEARVY
jgi:gamma-glutamyltranspeptidase/glutathione hydrolase